MRLCAAMTARLEKAPNFRHSFLRLGMARALLIGGQRVDAPRSSGIGCSTPNSCPARRRDANGGGDLSCNGSVEISMNARKSKGQAYLGWLRETLQDKDRFAEAKRDIGAHVREYARTHKAEMAPTWGKGHLGFGTDARYHRRQSGCGLRPCADRLRLGRGLARPRRRGGALRRDVDRARCGSQLLYPVAPRQSNRRCGARPDRPARWSKLSRVPHGTSQEQSIHHIGPQAPEDAGTRTRRSAGPDWASRSSALGTVPPPR